MPPHRATLYERHDLKRGRGFGGAGKKLIMSCDTSTDSGRARGGRCAHLTLCLLGFTGGA
jgi:hypothetical protein